MRSERGSILVLTALSLVVLLGIVGLAVDGSFMFTERNRMASAADAGAKSAAMSYRLNNASNLQNFANREATEHGFDPGVTTTVTVNRPPTSGPFTTNPNYVEVIVSRPTATFFSRVLNSVWSTMTPGARAVAGTGPASECLITLAPPTYSLNSLELGNSHLNMPNCSVASAGDIAGTNPNARITAASISAGASSCTGNCGNMGTISWSSPAPVDPIAPYIAAIPAGALSSCTPVPASGTIAAGCHSSLNVAGTRTLAAGEHYFTGPITYNNNSTLNGSAGVTMILANGSSFTMANNSDLIVTAPTSGVFPGIAIYQPASNSSPFVTANSSLLRITGAAYMPSADVSIRNGLDGTSDCVLFVVNSFDVRNGNGAFNNNCSAYGGSPLLTVTLAE